MEVLTAEGEVGESGVTENSGMAGSFRMLAERLSACLGTKGLDAANSGRLSPREEAIDLSDDVMDAD